MHHICQGKEDPGDDDDTVPVKLYDLTALCENTKKEEVEEEEIKDEGSSGEGEGNNPFRVAVGMLLYRVAKRMVDSKECNEAPAVTRQLLENCIRLLDKEKFPRLHASALIMLAEVYIPSDECVFRPDFPESRPEDDENGGGEQEREDPSTIMSESNRRKLCEPGFYTTGLAATQKPPPLTVDLSERCRIVLKHVLSGLGEVDSARTREDEHRERERKEQEWKERENIKMSRPNCPIPMPYDDGVKQEQDKEAVMTYGGGGRTR
jgi:hypothetical protein